MIKLGETYKNKCGNDVRIICVDKRGDLPIVGIVSSNHCGKEEVMTYTTGGTYWVRLREWSDFDLIIPEDYSTYIIDEPVMVRDGDSSAWVRSYFAGVSPVDGRPCAWDKQRTSWTETTRIVWSQCRRPTKEELEKRNESTN